MRLGRSTQQSGGGLSARRLLPWRWLAAIALEPPQRGQLAIEPLNGYTLRWLKYTSSSRREYEKSRRLGMSAMFAAEGTYSYHGLVRVRACSRATAWAISAQPGSLAVPSTIFHSTPWLSTKCSTSSSANTCGNERYRDATAMPSSCAMYCDLTPQTEPDEERPLDA